MFERHVKLQGRKSLTQHWISLDPVIKSIVKSWVFQRHFEMAVAIHSWCFSHQQPAAATKKHCPGRTRGDIFLSHCYRDSSVSDGSPDTTRAQFCDGAMCRVKLSDMWKTNGFSCGKWSTNSGSTSIVNLCKRLHGGCSIASHLIISLYVLPLHHLSFILKRRCIGAGGWYPVIKHSNGKSPINGGQS